MNLVTESSDFENIETNAVVPGNASIKELLPYQSNNSSVYKIRINDKWLLLKRILPEYREHPAYINALEKEFNLGFNLDHPHIVKYLNKGNDSEGLYLLSEYIDGVSLRNIIQKNPQGIEDFKLIRKIILQLLDALDYMHKQQIFHLDLKPENIVITHKGSNVKIIDLGLSCSDSYISVSSGTKKYCSPEQLNNHRNADARSDFYSLGLVFLELITGSTKLSGLKKIPSRYKKIITKCIEPLQENRYNSAEEIISILVNGNRKKYFLFGIIGLSGLIFSILFLIYFYKHSDNSGNEWKQLASLPEIRCSGKAIIYKDKIFYIGGADAVKCRNNTWVYDSRKNIWIEKAPIPTSRTEMGCALVDKKIYCFGGWQGDKKGMTNKAEIYDIENNTWDSLPRLPKFITSASAVSIKNQIYILGGTLGETKTYFFRFNTETLKYDSLNVFKNQRSNLCLIVINDRIIAIGGSAFKKGQYNWLDDVDEYNPNLNTWTKKANIPNPITVSSAVLKGYEIHLIGGSTIENDITKRIKNYHFVYNYKNNTWSIEKPLPFNIHNHQAVCINGKIIIIGGINEEPYPSKNVYIEE
ncbi:MAG: protein kinase [Bacteroidales bacterium]|jgi:serine/threonine protein kinase